MSPPSAWAPLRQRVYRNLWLAWLASNLSMWMHDVAAAWWMAALTQDPLWVALVQSAASLPVFLLALFSGAIADRVNRRNYLFVTQLWLALVACVLVALALWGKLGPVSLLILAFANGIGLSMRWPTYSASVPRLVSRAELSPALALNGIAMNSSRVIGPMLAGVLIALAGGPIAVFAVNAGLAIVAAWLISRWPAESAAPDADRPASQSLVGDMWQGVRYLRESSALRAVLIRAGVFFFHSAAVIALAPMVGKALVPGSAQGYTMLLAGLGLGAIVMGSQLQKVRRRRDRDDIAKGGSWLMALAMLATAYAPNLPLAVIAMFAAGAAWMAAANSFTLAAQLILPNGMRARGIAFYQMTMMGGMAAGAACWGLVASRTSVIASLTLAAASMVVCTWLGSRRYSLEMGDSPPAG